jgi:small GTP-binding protein
MNSLHDLPAFKIVLLGDSGVGKTSIVQRFEENTFNDNIDATIGASFLSKEMKTRHGRINLHIWDTAGQERYRSLVPTYARGAGSALVCYDVTDPKSFTAVEYWLKKMEEIGCTDCIKYLVGNKTDLERVVSQDVAQKWGNQHQMKFFEVSAKTGNNVENLFQELAEEIALKRPSAPSGSAHMPQSQPVEETGCC